MYFTSTIITFIRFYFYYQCIYGFIPVLLYVYIWLPWLRFFRAFLQLQGKCQGYNPQRRGTARTLPNFFVILSIVWFVSFSVLFVCKCVLYYWQRVATQLQLTNISYHTLAQDSWWKVTMYKTQLFLHWKLVYRKFHAIISMNKNCAQGLANAQSTIVTRYCMFCKLHPNKHTKSTPQCSSWDTNSSSATQGSPSRFVDPRNFVTALTRTAVCPTRCTETKYIQQLLL